MKNIFKLIIPILFIILVFSCKESIIEDFNAPVITEISPTEGYVNDFVTIKGSNFGPQADDNIVQFGENIAVILESSPTELKVVVPNGAGEVNVTVTTNQITSEGVIFKYLVPTLTLSSISPNIGIPGDEVILEGDNFNDNPHNNLVQFNEVVANVISASKTRLVVEVPEGSGEVNVTVSVGRNKSQSLSFTYTVENTRINAIVPESAFPGDEVKIRGAFKVPTSENIVTFGSQEATIVESSISELTVIVPQGSGTVDVKVTSADDESEPVQFTYATVQLTSISKESAQSLDTLLVVGKGFDPVTENNIIYFGSNLGEVIEATATELKAVVPEFLDDNADVLVNVKVNDGVSNSLDFHLLRYYTEVIAGNGEKGSSTSTVNAMEAAFTQPVNLALDAAGNLYIAEAGGATVRKLRTDGQLEFIAGKHEVTGSDDGTGVNATFRYPYDLVVDEDGNIYVADVTNKLIRKITPQGVVTTIAGSVNSTSARDGVGTEGTFRQPYSITIDNNGDLIVGDQYAIRKVSLTDYTVSTVAGDNLNAADASSVSSFNSPRGLAVGEDGTIFVSDALNNCIKKIRPDGTVVRLAGPSNRTQIGHRDGPGDQALFFNPQGLALAPDGNIFVSDGTQNQNYYLRKILPSGHVTTVMGTGGVTPFVSEGWGTVVPYKGWGVAIDDEGTIYLPDQQHLRIRKLYLK